MILSAKTTALRRRFYSNRHWLPLLLYPAAAIALFISRPFGMIPQSVVFTALCLLISLCGGTIRILTVGYMPRKREQESETGIETTSLNTQGMYSVVRHPLALGSLLIWTGIILFVGVWWFIVGALILYGVFTIMVLQEEEERLVAKFGDTYREWAQYSNALIPSRRMWVSNRYQFSPLQAIRREYIGFFCMVVAYVTIDLIRNRVIDFSWHLSYFWMVAGGITLLLTIFIRLIIKIFSKHAKDRTV